MTDAPPARIVVGIDGSPVARLALEFAIDEARLHKASLQVTYAYPAMAAVLTGSTGKDYYEQVENEARELLQGLVAAAPSTKGVEVEWVAVPGNPSEVLIEASQDAVMLVVGSRGGGGFMGLVMGSVSTQCVQYSHCPVLVIREGH
jgi:nucleotide-binding universal stress UspA family protein